MRKLIDLGHCLLLTAVLARAEQAHMPTLFVPNDGQFPQSILYSAQTPSLVAGFAKESVVFQVRGEQLQMRFAAASPSVRLDTSSPVPARVNFFRGQERHTGLAAFERLMYRGLYNGIDLSYAPAGSRIKAEFTVAARADPRQIRLEYSGANVAIHADGSLSVTNAMTELIEEPPFAYQDTGTRRIPVEAHFIMLDDHTVGFALGSHDPNLPLVIDPVISYSTYLGGSGISAV